MGPDAVAILLGAKLVTRSADTEFRSARTATSGT
jgi:hypothetical protein